MAMSNVRIFRAQKALGPVKEPEALWFVAALLLENDGQSPDQVVREIGERPGVAERSLTCVARFFPPQLGEPIPLAVQAVIDTVKELA